MDYKLIKLNLARNCLRYIIKTYHIYEIYIPYYICPTVIKAARKENCRIKFYHIDDNFYPTTKFYQDDFILYPNYFGICSENVVKLSREYKNLIVDNAHNFFMPNFGLASFNSLRKFFQVRDGAFLYIKKTIDHHFQTDTYVYEQISPLTYEEMVDNETRLDGNDIKFISKSSENIFNKINIQRIKNISLEEFEILNDKFKNKNELKIHLSKFDVPFIYPYLTYDENEAKRLINKGYTLLRYWNFLPETFLEHKFYKYLIPIPLRLNS